MQSDDDGWLALPEAFRMLGLCIRIEEHRRAWGHFVAPLVRVRFQQSSNWRVIDEPYLVMTERGGIRPVRPLRAAETDGDGQACKCDLEEVSRLPLLFDSLGASALKVGGEGIVLWVNSGTGRSNVGKNAATGEQGLEVQPGADADGDPLCESEDGRLERLGRGQLSPQLDASVTPEVALDRVVKDSLLAPSSVQADLDFITGSERIVVLGEPWPIERKGLVRPLLVSPPFVLRHKRTAPKVLRSWWWLYAGMREWQGLELAGRSDGAKAVIDEAGKISIRQLQHPVIPSPLSPDFIRDSLAMLSVLDRPGVVSPTWASTVELVHLMNRIRERSWALMRAEMRNQVARRRLGEGYCQSCGNRLEKAAGEGRGRQPSKGCSNAQCQYFHSAGTQKSRDRDYSRRRVPPKLPEGDGLSQKLMANAGDNWSQEIRPRSPRRSAD